MQPHGLPATLVPGEHHRQRDPALAAQVGTRPHGPGAERGAALVPGAGLVTLPWLNADVRPYAGFEEARPLFDEELLTSTTTSKHGRPRKTIIGQP